MSYTYPGNSYGLEYHFRWNTELSRVVVFNYVDQCIYGTFMFADYPTSRSAKILAEHDAQELCLRLNGISGVNIAGLDSTP